MAQTKKKAKAKRPRLAADAWKAPHPFEGKVWPAVPDPDNWMSMAEVVKALGCSLKTVTNYINNGTVKSKKHGYFRLIDKASVLKLKG